MIKIENLLQQLDDVEFYTNFIGGFLTKPWELVNSYDNMNINLDPSTLLESHEIYCQNVKSMNILLDSQNADHFKRTGCLIHALYCTRPILSVEINPDLNYLRDFYNVGVSFDDHLFYEKKFSFIEEYANDIFALDLCYRICAMYEDIEFIPNRSFQDFTDQKIHVIHQVKPVAPQIFALILKAFFNPHLKK